MRFGSLASLALVLLIAASALANAVRAEKASLLYPGAGGGTAFNRRVRVQTLNGND